MPFVSMSVSSARIMNDVLTVTRMLKGTAKNMNDKAAVKRWTEQLQASHALERHCTSGARVELGVDATAT